MRRTLTLVITPPLCFFDYFMWIFYQGGLTNGRALCPYTRKVAPSDQLSGLRRFHASSGIRTHDLSFRQKSALSAELCSHELRNLIANSRSLEGLKAIVDKTCIQKLNWFDNLLIPFVKGMQKESLAEISAGLFLLLTLNSLRICQRRQLTCDSKGQSSWT